MNSRRLVVVGTLAGNPFAGMAWMMMQMVVGLRRLGHDAYYMEFTSDWPYDPVEGRKSDQSMYPIEYLARVADGFGVGDRWGYRRSYSDFEWFGMTQSRAEELLASADAVFNVTGATRLAKEQLKVGRWIYHGTDPVIHEIAYAKGDPFVVSLINEHSAATTYGENVGSSESPLPPLPMLRAKTRQPVLLDLWDAGPPTRDAYTTVGNWRQVGLDVEFEGETYKWSKHHEFLKVLALPQLVGPAIELASNLAERTPIRDHDHEAVPALGVDQTDRARLEGNGWKLVSGPALSMDPWSYRSYIQDSRGEFTVARDLNVRLRSGWFSERSACYLAAGRPVIAQNTGFGSILPTGAGLFAFDTLQEAVAAFEEVESDYARHSRAAREIAGEYFRAETVLAALLEDLGL